MIQPAGRLRTLGGALLIAAMTGAYGCARNDPSGSTGAGEAASAASASSSNEAGESASPPARLESDDPRAGMNNTRPDSVKDVKPEPGTPQPVP